jgi:pimeloyl-ACP methyl ester carboxylesterase
MQGVLISLQSVQLHVCHTAGQAPAIVFIHGGLGNRFNWRWQWEFWQHRGRQVLVYDLAGHGDSAGYRRYSIGRHRRDLRRLLHHFQIEAPILCCHSYGVPIGLEWAKRHAISGLIAIAGGSHNLTPWWEIPLVKFLAAGGARLCQNSQFRQWIEAQMSRHTTERMQRFFTESPLPQVPHPYQAIASFWGYDGRPTLHTIDCPTIVMTGENDPTFPPAMGEALANHLRQSNDRSQHWVAKTAGHLVIAEAPDLVNQAIAQMLAWV